MNEEAWEWAARRCAGRETCASDIERHLRTRGIPTEETEEIIQRLYDERYLDDARYATAYARDKMRFDHWGRLKIGYSLRVKGIADGVVREALGELDEEEYLGVLRAVLETKRRSLHRLEGRALRQKLLAFAQQRGFELSLTVRLLGEEEE